MTERLHFQFSLSCIGEGNGNPLQCSCLENPRDGGAWWVAIYGVAQSRTQLKWLSSSSSRDRSEISYEKLHNSYSTVTYVCLMPRNGYEFFFTVPLEETSRYFKSNKILYLYLAAAAAKSLQLCPTLCDPIDSSPLGSPVPGILRKNTGVGCHFLLQIGRAHV